MKNVPDKYQQGQTWLDSNYITCIEVEERFGVSRQQQRNLYMKADPPDASYMGSTLCYWRATAEPWFAEYDARQKARVKSGEERKAKRKPGRPRKENKEDWRDTHLGDWHIIIGPEYKSAKSWFNAISGRMSRELTLNSPERAQWLETREALRAHFGIRAGL